jgi:hypothetical protein
MRRGATARLIGLALLGAALAVIGFAAPAAADVTSPPGPNTPPAAPGWIAFQLSSTNLTVGSTVQVSVAGGSTVGAAQFFTGPDWPSSWQGDGLTLQNNGSPCDFASHPSSSCGYTVTGNSGTFDNVLFGAGSIPPDQVTALEQTVTVTTPTTQPTTPPPPPAATFTGPPNGQLSGPGQFQFQSPNQPGVTYTWTLLFNGQQVDKQSGPAYTPPSNIFTTPGQYTLTLSASDGAYPNGVTSAPVQFEITPSSNPNPTPTPSPTPTPGASPTPAAPAPAVSPPAFTHLSTVSYVPLSNFDVPTPAAIRPVTVIWLWRPDWFQTAEAARTAGRPSPAKRASVSLNAKGSAGPSATPWLAGLATFGIFGFAWILVRRRRVRTSILD